MSAFDEFAHQMRLLARERTRIHRRDRVAQFFARVDDPATGEPIYVDPEEPGLGLIANLGRVVGTEAELIRSAAVHGSRFAATGGESRFLPAGTEVWIDRGRDRLEWDGDALEVFIVVVYGRGRFEAWWAEYRTNGTLGGWTPLDPGGEALVSHNEKRALMSALAPEPDEAEAP